MQPSDLILSNPTITLLLIRAEKVPFHNFTGKNNLKY